MHSAQLPLDTWIVVDRHSPAAFAVVSAHQTQGEAEAERDRRNREIDVSRFAACLVMEPIAERMGGRRYPTRQTHA